MNFIVAVDENWNIGKDNGLLFHIPEDMRYFREKTTGRVVVMGEATLRSLPAEGRCRGVPT
jgi:dihydrofolate reductase